jgi:hypothetical protein
MFYIVGTVTRYPDTGFFTSKSCPSCHQYVEMHEVAPTKYFSIFWIPLFPLGKKAPILECPICHERFYSAPSDNMYRRANPFAETKTAIAENPDVTTCKSCGQKLRLPKAGAYRCPKCKTVGHVEGAPFIGRTLARVKTSIQSIRITSRNRDNFAVGFVIIAFILVLFFFWKNNQASSAPSGAISAQAASAQQAVEKLEEKPLPRNGSLRISSGRDGVAPFKISTRSGAHNLVKLKNLDGSAETITVFVQDGRTVEVNVPIGSYELKIASGRKWYGYSKYFGREGSYSKAQDVLTFSYEENGISGHEISLYGVLNGNLKTHEMAPEDF